MIDDDFDFEASLHPGQVVQARWTNSNRYFVAKATVAKLNRMSLKVRLLENITFDGKVQYEIGQLITLPRLAEYYLTSRKYSENNRAAPANKYLVKDSRGVYGDQTVEAFSHNDAKAVALVLMYGCPLDQVDLMHVAESLASLVVIRLPATAVV